jgi:hypothetical protein
MDVIRSELDLIKGEIMNLAAETAALQAVMVELAKRMGALDPVLARAVSRSFDEAANFAESFAKGKAVGHLPETLTIIKQLRNAVTGGDSPNRGAQRRKKGPAGDAGPGTPS